TQVKSLQAINIESDSLKLKWKKQNVTGYQVFKYDTDSKSYKLLKTITSNLGTYTINNLSAGTTYQYKVRSYKTVGSTNYYGSYSSVLSGVTNLAQVENLKTSSRSSNSLNLTWKKQNGVTGYKIYQYDSKGKLLKNITSKANSYAFSKLSAGTTYQYKIRSYKSIAKTNHYGTFSSVLATTTNPATVVLSNVKKKSSTSMHVNWKRITGSTGYQIQYSTSSKFTSSNTKSVTITSKNTVTKTIKYLKKGEKYYVRVRACKTLSGKAYYGSWSSIKSIIIK
ncbi:fibronectin type III domain-containing protein, partial [Streptomyces sp. NPDC057927]